MDGLAAKEAVVVLSKSWSGGKKSPPSLECWLSNQTTLRLTIDDVLELTELRLYNGGGDCIDEDVFKWWTGLDTAVVDALLAEVVESNRQWWAEAAS